MKNEQQPEIELIECGSGDAERTTHPAFGLISTNRTSGHTKLFDSEFKHQSYITLRIKPAYVDRKLCRNWFHGGQSLIEISLSEAQWGTMLSSMNMGDGTPCTLQYVAGEQIPSIGVIESEESMHVREFAAHLEDVNEKVLRLNREIADSKMTNKLRSTLLARSRDIQTAANSNLKFVANSFSEHIESTVEKAKVEIASFARIAGMTKPLEIDDSKSKELPVHLPDTEIISGESE